MRIKFFLVGISVFFSLYLFAQETNPVIPETPPSPQAMAFNRLGNYEVNNNYGVPAINIPLFEINYHGYKIPLTLNYEASPIKAGYNYDVTGFGWTLSGNSCVSRTIKDRADEDGLFNNPFSLDNMDDPNGNSRTFKSYSEVLDKLNFQYDSYNMVLPSGRTIPFVMHKSNGVMQYELMTKDSGVKIVCHYRTNIIDSFTVTDENGIVYDFTVADTGTNNFQNDPNTLKNVTWLLTCIDIPAKGTILYRYNDLVTINTTNPIIEPTIRVSRMLSERAEDTNDRRFYVYRNDQKPCPRYDMRFIKSIHYGPTNIEFCYTDGGKHMEKIIVTDKNDTLRTFSMAYDAYSTSLPSSLKSLVISGKNKDDKLSYRFCYSGKNPGYYTDYWGNRCEKGNIEDLGNFNMYFDQVGLDRATIENHLAMDSIPVRIIDCNPDDPNYYFKLKLQSSIDGDSRQPTSPEHHGVLTAIYYPNGGHTTFNYENHRFLTATSANGDIIFDRRKQRVIEGGGFRIESIKNWAADGTLANEDYYRYGFAYRDVPANGIPLPLPEYDTLNGHIGYGEAVVDPNILTFMDYSYSSNLPQEGSGFRNMIVGLKSSCKNIVDIQGRPVWWDAYFSANTFRSLIGGRRPVVYPEITVYHGQPYEFDECKSKTVYKYDIYSNQLDDKTYYMSTFDQTSKPDTAYFEALTYEGKNPRLYCLLQDPAKRHILISKSDYSYSYEDDTRKWNLVCKEEYKYNKEYIIVHGQEYNSWISRGHCGLHNMQLSVGKPLDQVYLQDFYQYRIQRYGSSTLSDIKRTIYRQEGKRRVPNTMFETFSYAYSDVLSLKTYSDIYDRHFDIGYAKDSRNTYVGQIESNDPIIQDMKSRNMLTSLVTSVNKLDGRMVTEGTKIDYDYFEGNILPSVLYTWNGDLEDSNAFEATTKVLCYDSHGNPTEILDMRTDIYSAILWDDYGRYMTAMIKNARFGDIIGISSQLSAKKSLERHAILQSSFPNSQIETWDYIPLIGVSSHTDITGKTMQYEYDGLGRLKSVYRTVSGKKEIIQEYEYNFINE